MKDFIQRNIYFVPQQFEEVKDVSNELGISFAALVRIAVDFYLKSRKGL